jgi:alanyl-tRNA synthetase
VGCDCDRYLELWNLVFMQFERSADGVLTPLPKPSIDTGAGLERLAAVLQGVRSNFDTDLFRPIIAAVEALCGTRYGAEPAADVSMRVIADHARSTAFLVTDGVLPSNEGRGYVLRRIMRRALRHGRMLGLEEPFMAAVTGRVVEEMQEAYPELAEAKDYVARVARGEEERFGHTLRVGMRMVDGLLEAQKAAGSGTVPGPEIFKLYDTYGFPLDLLRDIATDQGFALDEAGFERAMEEQRAMARESWVGSGETEVPAHLRELSTRLTVERRWYTDLEIPAGVVTLFAEGSHEPLTELAEGRTGEVILDRTPFYPEAGGQVGDTGRLRTEDGLSAEVVAVQRPVPNLVVHTVKVTRGSLRVGSTVSAAVDAARRGRTARNHTATHLLHAALRQVLGDHVKQAGSLVAPDRLRFDFSHFAPLTPQEIDRIEELVNEQVWENRGVRTEEKGLDEAVKAGATALFGEKYGERVRVVTVEAFSQELCGGTHIKATGEIGLFKIVGQGGVAAGVRRIEAVTGPGAYQHVRREEGILAESAARLKSRPLELVEKVEKLAEANRELERERERLQARLAGGTLEQFLAATRDVDGVRVAAGRVESMDAKGMRELGDRLRDRLGSGVVVLVAEGESRLVWVTMVTKDLVGRLHAGHLARELATLTGGGGGGRPDMAEAGGKDPARIGEALEKLPGLVRAQLAKKR